jgi:hypothetical protein
MVILGSEYAGEMKKGVKYFCIWWYVYSLLIGIYGDALFDA